MWAGRDFSSGCSRVRLAATFAAAIAPRAQQGGIVPKPRTAPKPKAKPRVQRAKAPVAPGKTPLKVKVVPAGPQAAALAKVASRVLSNASVQKSLGSGRHRLLTVEPVEHEEGKGTRRLAAAE